MNYNSSSRISVLLLTKFQLMVFLFLLLACVVGITQFTILEALDTSQLSLDYYSKSCPAALHIVRQEMECAVRQDRRNAAIILRLHFHDCFVQGCDGSVLLDDTATLTGEKRADQNANSLKGFDLVNKVGGPYWDVPVGRLDSKTASLEHANIDIPSPKEGLLTLMSKFMAKGLSVTDMVALVGSHTIGVSRCVNYRERIYGDFQQTSKYAPASEIYLTKLKETCPTDAGDDNITPMDYFTPVIFDNAFFGTLLSGDGLLNSDQEMFSSLIGFETASLVAKYWADPIAFFMQFSDSMVKMGNITNPADL